MGLNRLGDELKWRMKRKSCQMVEQDKVRAAQWADALLSHALVANSHAIGPTVYTSAACSLLRRQHITLVPAMPVSGPV